MSISSPSIFAVIFSIWYQLIYVRLLYIIMITLTSYFYQLFWLERVLAWLQTVGTSCFSLLHFSLGLPRSGKNVWKMIFFTGNFVDGQGNLERTWKVREKSGNLKIDSYGSLQKIVYSVQNGKGCTFSWDSLSPPPSWSGATVKGKNLLPEGANSFL